MTADYAFTWVKNVCRKNQFGEIQPEFFNSSVSTAQDNYYDWLIGFLEGYQYGKPVPKVAAGMSMKIARWLLPLKTNNEAVTVNAGIATCPLLMDYPLLVTDSANRKVERIDDTKKPGRLNSKIDPITDASSPFLIEADGSWEIYPSSVTQIFVNYYKRPPAVIWGYTRNSNGRAVYNQATSTDPVFDDVSMRKVLARAIRIMGFSFTEPDWVEYGKEVKMGGE